MTDRTQAEARELLKTTPLSNWQEVSRLTKIIYDTDLARYKRQNADQQRRIRELEAALGKINHLATCYDGPSALRQVAEVSAAILKGRQ